MRVSTQNFVDAMQDLIKNQTEENTRIFEQEILDTQFCCPIVFLNEKDTKPLNERDITFITVTDANDDTFFLAFTHEEEFKTFRKDNNFSAINVGLSDFKHMLEEVEPTAKGFVINIGKEALFISKDTFM